ncbi:HPr family phosphocarrier protein, partial [Candidatus Kapabacteria bacterium]|nr:HPr family phosphocarrier protein [Candidatus Kapabacteria bacterium]
MVKSKLQVINKNGLHTRPAAKLVKVASNFKSQVEISRDGFKINAKSIIGVMTLAAEYKSEIDIYIDGPDEQEALEAIMSLFK